MTMTDSVAHALHQARGHGLSFKQIAQQLSIQPGLRGALRDRLVELLDSGRATFDGQRYRLKVKAPPQKGQEQQRQGKQQRRARHGQVVQERQRPEKQPRRRPEQQDEHDHEHVKGVRGDEVIAILHVKSEGYGFASPLSGGTRADDLFIPPQDAQKALDGDVVRVKPIRGRDGRRAGRLIDIVEPRRRMVMGLYHLRGKGAVVEPNDRGLTHAVLVPRAKDARDGDVVKVRLDRETPPDQGLRGEVIEVLGPPGDPRYEMLAALYANGFSDEFDAATEADARHVPDHVRQADLEKRRDLRKVALVTIDGEDARDFDDAIHVSRAPNGYRLVVAIADVAHYVRPGTALDREGLRRATSVYFPGRAVPMLPERLSNGICSLNPNVDRLCMVADMALDQNGTPIDVEIYDAVMKSHARLTYTQVAAALDGKPDDTTRPLLPDLQIGYELSQKLTEKRRQRGSIDFDLAEVKVVLRDDGTVERVEKRERNAAHRLIEEFMLAANEAVARYFDARGLPTVYRIHDQPDAEKLAAFAQLAQTSGFMLDPERMTSLALNQFLAELEGKPQQRALHSLLLRAMMQAQYSPENIGHYGLAAPTYLHFTSPIRRYPDLMVHRLLKEHWARAGEPLTGGQREREEARLAEIAAQCSERERAAMKAERDVAAFYAALFMKDHIGERLEAVVSGIAEVGLFCELKDYLVEGLVRAELLGEGAEFDEDLHRLVVPSTGLSFAVGDEITVDVLDSDPARRRIELGFVEKGAQDAERRKPEERRQKPRAEKGKRQRRQA
jgi:ribonuclease R